jgi:hypothetical protein
MRRLFMDKSELENLGLDVSNKFINEHIDLNETIAKFAKEYDLNDQQIQRVIEIANNLTYMSILNTSDNRDVAFPVANSEKVSSILSLKTPLKKQASESPINYETMTESEADISPMDVLIKEALKIENANKSEEDKQFLLDEYEMLKQAKEFVDQKLWDLTNRYTDLVSKVASELINVLCNKSCTKDDVKNMLSTVSIKTAGDIATQVYQQIQDGEYAEVEGRKHVMSKEDATPIISKLNWIDTTNNYNDGWKSVSSVIDTKIKGLEEKGIKI